jgi:hypothetical protein
MIRSTKLLLFVSGLAVACASAHADTVGNVGAVNQTAHGTPPGRAAHKLSLGVGVENRERIDTTTEGSAQIVFRDTSTMTVGRNSSVTVDHFVYNGEAGSGSQGVNLAKGVLRFVGGGVSHGGGTNVRTPTASIGVRGGTALFWTKSPCGGQLVALQYGEATITSSHGAGKLKRPGFGVCVSPNGDISEPFIVPPEWIAQMEAALTSDSGQHGGASILPSNPDANLRLGNARPPNDTGNPSTPSILDQLNIIWTGNTFVESQSSVNNLPGITPPPPPAHERGGGSGGPVILFAPSHQTTGWNKP